MKIPFNQFKDIFLFKFGHHLTDEQAELLDALYHFVFQQDGFRLFILKGYAGTGKTSVVASLIKTLTDLKIKTKLLAPTGRAAKVIGNKSGKQALTIHKQIYRRSSSVEANFHLSLMPNLHTSTIFIVDEVSMLSHISSNGNGGFSSRSLLEDLIEYVASGKNCLLIFIGDEGQLPPVGEVFSPALNVGFIQSIFPTIKISSLMLKDVVRQSKQSGILKIATHVRNVTDSHQKKFLVEDLMDVRKINGIEFQEILETSYDRMGVEETLIITRSNKRANAYNNQIRNRIFWMDDIITSADYLMVVKNNYYWLSDNSEVGFIANGEILKVRKLKKMENVYGRDFAHVIVDFVDYPMQHAAEVIILIDSLNCDGPSLPREYLKELFFEIEKDYLHEKNKKKRYDLIVKNPYFNALQVKYSYAITCHKSQGGQWKHVFVDNVSYNDDFLDESLKRWLYTAFTRAMDQLYLVNFDDNHFI
jgi:exodeoxyribonuclease-5